jgi:putative ABC transport system ATP-binding protein
VVNPDRRRDPEPPLRLEAVTVRLGERLILDDVTMEVGARELVWLRGPSGVGKTILVELLAGFRTPDAGRVLAHGEPVSAVRPPSWRAVAVVPQSLGVAGHLTVREQVSLPLVLSGHHAGARPARTPRRGRDPGARDDLIELIELVELDGAVAQGGSIDAVHAALVALDLHELEARLGRELSLGQRQRLAMARALAARPDAVVADEPTSHQDGAHAGLVLRALADLVDAGASAVVASHDPALGEVATRVLHLHAGRLVPDPPGDETRPGVT